MVSYSPTERVGEPFFTFRPDPAELVKDPMGDDTLAAPLGTYRKGN